MARYVGVLEVATSATLFGVSLSDGSQVQDLEFNKSWRIDQSALATDSLDTVTKTLISSLPVFTNDPNKFLNDQGVFTIPTGITNNYTSPSFTSVTSVTINHGWGVDPEIQCVDTLGFLFEPMSVYTEPIAKDTSIVYFDRSTSGSVLLTVGADSSNPYTTKSVDYQLTTADETIEVIVTGKTMTLPDATTCLGQPFEVICATTTTICDTLSSQTIGNLTTGNPITFTLVEGEVLKVKSNGTNFRMI